MQRKQKGKNNNNYSGKMKQKTDKQHEESIRPTVGSQKIWKKMVFWFPRAGIMKYHRLGDINNINVLFHSSEGQKSKIKLSTRFGFY